MGVLLGPSRVFRGHKSKTKEDKRTIGPWIIIGGFRSKYALVLFRGSYVEVDLRGMRATNRKLGAIASNGALRLHLPSAKSPLHYLVDSQTLIFLSGMGNGISNRNKTTWPTAEARVTPREFYAPGLNQQIAIYELGG